MAVMTYLLAAAMMAVTAVASPVAQDKSLLDPNCGTVCDVAPPFEGAVCYEVQRDDGTCHAVFLNANIGKLTINGAEVNSSSHDPYKTADFTLKSTQPLDTREEADNDRRLLAKRLEFESDKYAQRVCGLSSCTCHDRGRGARIEHCKDILLYFYHNHGRWVIDKFDIAGRHWLTLMESGTCLFAVGHPNPDLTEGETRIGNSDIYHIIIVGTDYCVKEGNLMELQGMSQCRNWPLEYWVTSRDKFDCCGGALATDLLNKGNGKQRGGSVGKSTPSGRLR